MQLPYVMQYFNWALLTVELPYLILYYFVIYCSDFV